jgi:hypothetical protein
VAWWSAPSHAHRELDEARCLTTPGASASSGIATGRALGPSIELRCVLNRLMRVKGRHRQLVPCVPAREGRRSQAADSPLVSRRWSRVGFG